MGEFRRMDDQVDGNGVPMSPAHRQLWDRISSVQVGIESHITGDFRASQSSIKQLLKNQATLADSFFGPLLEPDIDGVRRRHTEIGTEKRIESIADDVALLNQQFTKFTKSQRATSSSQRVSIYTAGITAGGFVIVKVIELVGMFFERL